MAPGHSSHRAPGFRRAALLAAWALLLSREGQAALPESYSAVDYLSEEAFPGLHVLERTGDEGRFLLHRWGQRPERARREPKVADASHWGSWPEAREALEELLSIPRPEPLQLPWALFDAQGHRIESVPALKDLDVAFILEIGQWMWPAVRIGFEQKANGVHDTHPAILRTLSLRPVVFEVREFIAKEEADEVMKIGRKQGLHTSKGVLQSADVKRHTKHSQFRTSKQAWLHNGEAPVVAELDERVAKLTRVPASHNEPVQLLRYGEGQYYHGHMDWTELELYPDQRPIWFSSHFGHQDRLATVFWYLNDVAEGGETIFPKHGQPICKMEERGGKHTRQCEGAKDPDMTSCDKGLKVFPRQGTVILWYNFLANGRGDRNALHAGCPVGKNLTKWSANKWVRIKPLEEPGLWVEGHPAMARHGWVGSQERPLDDNTCLITFTNSAGRSVDLMWYNPRDRAYRKLTSISEGATLSQQSFLGHRFQLRAGNRRSNEVACEGSSSDFELSSTFSLQPVAAGDLEL